jgi:hypothetical protein
LIILQAVFAIAFESVIFAFHSKEINMINDAHLNINSDDELKLAFANARSLLVYFILFMIAQLFTVVLVVDAVKCCLLFFKKIVCHIRKTDFIFFIIDLSKKYNSIDCAGRF